MCLCRRESKSVGMFVCLCEGRWEFVCGRESKSVGLLVCMREKVHVCEQVRGQYTNTPPTHPLLGVTQIGEDFKTAFTMLQVALPL